MLNDDAGTSGRLGRTELLELGLVALLVSLVVVIVHRSLIAKQIIAAFPVGQVVFSEVDDRGFRIANALGETSWRWDQLGAACANAGVLGLPDRLAVRPERSVPQLMPQRPVWVPRALVPDAVLVRLDLAVAGPTSTPSSGGFPRGTAVTKTRTWVVTADSQSRLARDAWLTLMLERKMLATQLVLVVVVAWYTVVTALMARDGHGVHPASVLFLVAYVLSIWTPWWMARREVRTLFPVGFDAWLQVEDGGLRMQTARDERVVPWHRLQGSRLRRSAVTYPGRFEPMTRWTIPARLVPDEVLRRLGCRPPGARTAEAESAPAAGEGVSG